MEPVAAPLGPSLVEIQEVELSGVPEPSGLVLDQDGEHLWTVSDQTGFMYRLTMSGNLVEEIDLDGEDLEGIAVNPADGSIFVVEESLGQVLNFDREGNLLQRITVEGLPSMGNSGLEGITINPANGHIFLLKEKNPGLLVELNPAGDVLAINDLGFAGDFSGLSFDTDNNQLMILSDQSATLNWCTLEGQKLKTLYTHLDKGEGVAFSSVLNKIFLVSDSQATLSTYHANSESSSP